MRTAARAYTHSQCSKGAHTHAPQQGPTRTHQREGTGESTHTVRGRTHVAARGHIRAHTNTHQRDKATHGHTRAHTHTPARLRHTHTQQGEGTQWHCCEGTCTCTTWMPHTHAAPRGHTRAPLRGRIHMHLLEATHTRNAARAHTFDIHTHHFKPTNVHTHHCANQVTGTQRPPTEGTHMNKLHTDATTRWHRRRHRHTGCTQTPLLEGTPKHKPGCTKSQMHTGGQDKEEARTVRTRSALYAQDAHRRPAQVRIAHCTHKKRAFEQLHNDAPHTRRAHLTTHTHTAT